MSNELETLAKKRDGILLAEIGAWLHMLDKYDWRFIELNCGGKQGYNHQKFFSALNGYPDLFSLFSSPILKNIIAELDPPLTNPPDNFRTFIEDHAKLLDARKGSTSLSKLAILMVEGHGRGSSIEKGTFSKLLNFQNQYLPDIKLNTAVGFSKFLSNVDYQTESLLREELDRFFKEFIPEVKNKTVSWNVRMHEFRKIINRYFPLVLAETRKPTNDVTLIDQTVAAVAFFKAALTERVVRGTWRPLTYFQLTQESLTMLNKELPEEIWKKLDRVFQRLKDKEYETEGAFSQALNLKSILGREDSKHYRSTILKYATRSYLWRILSIRINTPDYLTKSVKLPDLLSRKKRLRDAQKLTRILIEILYPLGIEIYRDQSTIAFLVAGEGDILSWKNKKNISLLDMITSCYTKRTDGEIQIHLENALILPKSRSIYAFGDTLDQASPRNIPALDNVKKNWKNPTNEDICTNCQLRPQGASQKAKDRNICDTCLKKRASRSKQWCKKPETTVWIDEVADLNGRVALLTCQFELTHWLNGSLWNSVRAILYQSSGEFLSYTRLYHEIRQSFKSNVFGEILTQCLDKNIIQEYDSKFLPYFEEVILPDWADVLSKISAQNVDEQFKSYITTIHLLRQQPSFARIRRVWETTRNFFESVQKKIESGTPIPKVTYRFILEGDLTPPKLGDYHSYDTYIDSIKMSFVWDSQKTQFISADNLAYIAKLLGKDIDNFYEDFKGFNEIEFYEEGRPGKSPQKVASLTNVKVKAEKHYYSPTVPILTEPQLFMVLLPAEEAMEVGKYIQWKYEREFSKVRNRLPLHLSLVYFQRRTPLRAAMDAGQRMLKRKSHTELWRVQENHNYESQHLANLCLENNKGRTLEVLMDYGFDDSSEDYHYPYFFIESSSAPTKPENRPHSFKAPLPKPPDEKTNLKFKTLVHVSELQKGDEVYYTPSTFDFEFLDTTGRRFEIQYNEKGQRVKGKPNRPYFLEQIAEFQTIWALLSGKHGKGLTTSQINALEDLIEKRRREWNCKPDDTTFQQFVIDSLHNIDDAGWWKSLDVEEQELTRQAMQSGMLADVLEIYMEIMKHKPEQNT